MNPINNILWAIGAALGVVIAAIIIWLSLANAHLKTQLAEAQANDTACHLANDNFTTAIARQNRAVQDLQKNAVAHEMQARHMQAEAQKLARHYSVMAQKLRAQKMQGDACVASEKLINSYLNLN